MCCHKKPFILEIYNIFVHWNDYFQYTKYWFPSTASHPLPSHLSTSGGATGWTGVDMSIQVVISIYFLFVQIREEIVGGWAKPLLYFLV